MFTTEAWLDRESQIRQWPFDNLNDDRPWPGFVEILKLEGMLAETGIPYKKRVLFGGWIIVMRDNDGNYIGDAIEHCGSYGRESDLIEIAGFDIDEAEVGDSVIGNLSASEAFEYFKRAFEKLSKPE